VTVPHARLAAPATPQDVSSARLGHLGRSRGAAEVRARDALHAGGCLAAGVCLDVGRQDSVRHLPLWPYALHVVQLLTPAALASLSAPDARAGARVAPGSARALSLTPRRLSFHARIFSGTPGFCDNAARRVRTRGQAVSLEDCTGELKTSQRRVSGGERAASCWAARCPQVVARGAEPAV
jgi:hypothetical protein